MSRRVICACCRKEFAFPGWISSAAGATVYASSAGEIFLCSTECDQEWCARKGDPTADQT